MQRRILTLGGFAAVALTASCNAKRTTDGAPSSPSASASAAPVKPRAPKEAPLAGERAEIPGGSWFGGSTPGDPGRVPELEPRRFKLELGPFQIDRLPYPNDPQKPPLTGISRDEARRLCAERNARLCTELEWERACKGPESEEFASGAAWDPRCTQEPRRCASGFDVLALSSLREWTASDVIAGKDSAPKAAVRGAPNGAAASERRCAARRALDVGTTGADLGFRCCTGAPNAAVVPEPKLGATFEKTRITAEQLEKLLARWPETQSLAKDIRFFKEPDSAETVVARGPGDRKGFTFSVAPLLWGPVAGARFLLISARSGEQRSFIVALHVLGEGDYRLAATFVMENEPGPVAFAYDDFIRPRLHFSSCWGCLGETGKILFRKPERVAILQP